MRHWIRILRAQAETWVWVPSTYETKSEVWLCVPVQASQLSWKMVNDIHGETLSPEDKAETPSSCLTSACAPKQTNTRASAPHIRNEISYNHLLAQVFMTP